MENINNNFDERLKKYSEKIKSMEIVYRDGRVKCINNKNIIDLKRNNIKDKSSYIRSEKLKKKKIINNEKYSILKNIDSIILKLIFTCIILISMPFFANKIANLGFNEFISGIGTIFISYFIINIIWVFLK